MVFNRDMMTNVPPVISNLIAIGNQRQQFVDKNTGRVNLSRINHDYSIGDRVKFV